MRGTKEEDDADEEEASLFLEYDEDNIVEITKTQHLSSRSVGGQKGPNVIVARATGWFDFPILLALTSGLVVVEFAVFASRVKGIRFSPKSSKTPPSVADERDEDETSSTKVMRVMSEQERGNTEPCKS